MASHDARWARRACSCCPAPARCASAASEDAAAELLELRPEPPEGRCRGGRGRDERPVPEAVLAVADISEPAASLSLAAVDQPGGLLAGDGNAADDWYAGEGSGWASANSARPPLSAF